MGKPTILPATLPLAVRRVLTAVVTGLGLVVIGTVPALADCDGPYPSFTRSAPTARQVVIGDVVDVLVDEETGPDGLSAKFLLRGWSVLDGDRPVEITVDHVSSQQCAGWLVARVGDTVAIAFEGHDFEPAATVNAIAWIDDPAPFEGLEVLSVAQVYAILGRPAPDRIPPTAPTPAASPLPAIALGIVGVVAVIAVGVRLLIRRGWLVAE